MEVQIQMALRFFFCHWPEIVMLYFSLKKKAKAVSLIDKKICALRLIVHFFNHYEFFSCFLNEGLSHCVILSWLVFLLVLPRFSQLFPQPLNINRPGTYSISFSDLKKMFQRKLLLLESTLWRNMTFRQAFSRKIYLFKYFV